MTFKRSIDQYPFLCYIVFIINLFIIFSFFIGALFTNTCCMISLLNMQKKPKYPSRICSKNVNNSNCICCDSCDQWIHKKCSGLSIFQFMQLSDDPSSSWLCGVCLCGILSFGHLDDISFNNILNAVDCKICPKPILDDDSICCDICQAWLHINCADLTYKNFKKLSKDVSTPWYCKTCTRSIFPFGQLNNKTLERNLRLT